MDSDFVSEKKSGPHSSHKSICDADVERVKEIFKQVPTARIKELLENHDVHTTVEILIGEASVKSDTDDDDGFPVIDLTFDKATTEDEINALLDKPSCMMILNQSRSIIRAVTKSNKDALLQQLIMEEVIIRREANLKAFRRGLSVLGITSIVEEYPDLLRPLFIEEQHPLTASQFNSLIDSEQPSDPLQSRAYEMFMDFVTHIEGDHDLGCHVSLPALLLFITGASSIPPMGMKNIQPRYQPEDKVLPYFAACGNRVFLPICHQSKEQFFAAFKIALEFGGGFGCV